MKQMFDFLCDARVILAIQLLLGVAIIVKSVHYNDFRAGVIGVIIVAYCSFIILIIELFNRKK